MITAGPRSELVTAVADGGLDVALAAEGDLVPAGTRFQPLLADEPLLAVVAPDDPLARRKRVSLAEIAGEGRAWNSGRAPSCAATLTPPSGRPGSAGPWRSSWAS